MRTLVLALLGLAAVAAALAPTPSLEGYQAYELVPQNAAHLQLLETLSADPQLDFWSRGRILGKPSVVMAGPARQSELVAAAERVRMPWSVLVADVQMAVDAERQRQRSQPSDHRITFTAYNRYSQIVSYLNELEETYPDLVTVDRIGVSSEGRDVPLIKISSGGGGRRPVVLVDAGIHAREWIAPAVALYIIQQLVENTNNRDLIANVDWHIIPLLNPDGYEYTHTGERLWRKTRSVTSSCGSADKRQGVDGNRNFGFHWMENGASSNPCAETYAGPEAFSEPETEALRQYTLSIADRTPLYITFHSYGNYFLYPWGYTSQLPSDWKQLDDLAQAANAAQMAAGGKPYEIGSSTNVLYAAAGGSDDWVKGVGGVPLAYTVELPGGGIYGFDLPASAIQRTVSQFFPAVRVFGEHVAANYGQ